MEMRPQTLFYTSRDHPEELTNEVSCNKFNNVLPSIDYVDSRFEQVHNYKRKSTRLAFIHQHSGMPPGETVGNKTPKCSILD